jgi:hypothetical protein
MALAVSIFTLAVIGGLAAGAFFVGFQEQRVGRNSMKVKQAFGAGEAGAQTQLAAWDKDVYGLMAFGDTLVFGGSLNDGSGWYRGTVRRMSDMIYWIRSEGFSRDSTARQHIGALVRLVPFELNTKGAFTTVGNTVVRGTADVSGVDTPPGGWGACGPPETARAGVALPDPTDVTTLGAGSVDGTPPVMGDTTIDASSILVFGDLTFNDLVGLSDVSLAPGVYGPQPSYTGGQCNRSDPLNWGDPIDQTTDCANHFPIVYASGNLLLATGFGQGILLVDGDLTLQGNMQFFGAIIVRGNLITAGFGNTVHGSVVASNAGNTIDGTAQLQYSSCALEKALAAAAPGAPMRERGWAQLY